MLRYDYEELKNKALNPEANKQDIDQLGEWFEQYGNNFWNGEYYEIDSCHRLYPVYEEVTDDEFEFAGYTIK